jgi:cell division protein FtsN
MKMKYLLSCVVLWFVYTTSFAQDTTALRVITLKEDPVIEKYYRKATGNIAITTKEDIAKTAKGYRVQIYNGNNRTQASEAKMNFIKKFPGVRSYIVFNNPQYRVRVGDFANKEDAEVFQEKVQKEFQPTMVIPDLINVSGKTIKP